MFINASNHVRRHEYERELIPYAMGERIVIKLGGGLLTEKSELRTPRLDIMKSCILEIQEIMKRGYDVILVHGAGSYGHMLAKEFRIAEGYLEHFSHEFEGCRSQVEAVQQIRKDMLELNQYIFDECTALDISAMTIPTHRWASNTGPQFCGDLDLFSTAPSGIVTICYGDVVDCEGSKQFGILSGDDLVYRIASEVDGVRRVVFALGGVDGVLEQPPEVGKEQLLIPLMNPAREYTSMHNSAIDVTGGIGLKVQRSFELARNGIEVIFVNGEVRGRIIDAALNEPVIGTKFALFAQ